VATDFDNVFTRVGAWVSKNSNQHLVKSVVFEVDYPPEVGGVARLGFQFFSPENEVSNGDGRRAGKSNYSEGTYTGRRGKRDDGRGKVGRTHGAKVKKPGCDFSQPGFSPIEA
jgi:hypothetical protein